MPNTNQPAAATEGKTTDPRATLLEIRRQHRNAYFTLEDLQDDYFERLYEPESKAHWLEYEFERNRARADIIFDCLAQIDKLLTKLGIESEA